MENWGLGQIGGVYDNWPKNEKGEPVAPAFLEHLAEGQMDAEIQTNLLGAFGIPVVIQYPNDGSFGRVIIGLSGTGVDLFVPETLLDDARNIISGDIVYEDDGDDGEGEDEK